MFETTTTKKEFNFISNKYINVIAQRTECRLNDSKLKLILNLNHLRLSILCVIIYRAIISQQHTQFEGTSQNINAIQINKPHSAIIIKLKYKIRSNCVFF